MKNYFLNTLKHSMFLFIAFLGTAAVFSQSIQTEEMSSIEHGQLTLTSVGLAIPQADLPVNTSAIGGKGGRGTDMGSGQYSDYACNSATETESDALTIIARCELSNQHVFRSFGFSQNPGQSSYVDSTESVTFFTFSSIIELKNYPLSLHISLPIETCKVGGGKSSDTGLLAIHKAKEKWNSSLQIPFVVSEHNFALFRTYCTSKIWNHGYS